jgi:hypothetical protein
MPSSRVTTWCSRTAWARSDVELIAPHIMSRRAASDAPTTACGCRHTSARVPQSSAVSPGMSGVIPVRSSSATTMSSSTSNELSWPTPRAFITSATVLPSASAFSGANVSTIGRALA